MEIINDQQTNEIVLSEIRCPNCGEKILYKKGDKEVICMACGKSCSTNEKRNATENADPDRLFENKLKIDGIKTSSSALAYIEQYLDTYDWEAFAFDPDIIIDELEMITENLRVSSADDYKTWVACFISTVVPYKKKIEYSSKIYESIIEEYKKGNLDSYGIYDVYKKVVSSVIDNYTAVNLKADKYLYYAQKYNLPKEDEINLEKNYCESDIKKLNDTIYESIEYIPEIARFLKEKEDLLVAELNDIGINAQEKYNLANNLVCEQKFIEALDILYSLKGYKDSKEIIDRINKLFTLSSDVFINEGVIYYLPKNDSSGKRCLYKTEKSKTNVKAIVKDVGDIITNYADILYYFDGKNIKYVNLVNGKHNSIDKSFDTKKYFVRKRIAKAYFLYDGANDRSYKALFELDLKNGCIYEIKNGIKSVTAFKYHYVQYVVEKNNTEKTIICDLDTREEFEIIHKKAFVVDYFDNKVIYTVENPSKYNKKLYVYNFDTKSTILLESNINGKCKIIDNRIYYYTVDNLNCHYLITIDSDGKNRKELSPYVKDVLFSSGEWLYFIKGDQYNSTLCKMKLDGTYCKAIASQVDEFVKTENGYLYYIDKNKNLHQARMDGTKNRLLCYLVEKVLKIANNSVVYTAEDQKGVTSVYAIDFGSQGRRKASYNVLETKLYDDNTIYYIARVATAAGSKRYLCKLNLSTYSETKIAELFVPQKASGCYIATCVYGSYDCPEVWRFRRYRDEYLASRWWGRIFIKLYYAVSPKLVNWFGQKSWFRDPIKNYLDGKLRKLEKRGYSGNPYIDKY
ncbi:MAG: DUF5050 domain-containing protein [Clostridia bacterium]|nr:DUF5050 domain-containing protein [Clostridia bacterium]